VAEGVVDDISHEGLRVLLRAEGVSFQRVKTWKASKDPQYAAKKARVEQLYAIAGREAVPQDGDPEVIFCVDEFGPLNLQPRPGRQWAAVSGKNKEPGRAPRPRMRATYTRTAGVRHLFAAYELGEDKLFGHIKPRMTRARFLEFCRYLRTLYPASVLWGSITRPGLSSALSDLLSRLPARASAARLSDGAGRARGVQGCRHPRRPAGSTRQIHAQGCGPDSWCLVPFNLNWYHVSMALNIKDPETERLAAEVAALTGTTKTGAVRYALRQVLQAQSRLSVQQREERLTRFLEEEIWPLVPPDQLGKPVSKAEREKILGFGEHGA
jgi:hypothetical protein